MDINRHNYESFFLLYADRELSASEKEAVEFFVQQNPDLKEEFAQLQELVLPAESFGFDKSVLFKNEESISPLEEKMLLHLDGELNETQAKELEVLLLEDKNLQATYDLLQKTKLDPAEASSFGNKNLLYRYERAMIVNIRILKWAAAAILLGFGLFAGLTFLNSGSSVVNGSEIPVANNGNGVGIPDKPVRRDSSLHQQTQNEKNSETAAISKNNVKNADTANTTVPASKSKKASQVLLVKGSLKQINQPDDKIKKDRTNMATANPEDKKKISVNNALQQPLTVQQPEPEKLIAQAPEKINVEDRNETLAPLRENIARQAVFTEPETTGNDKILYMNEDNVTRSKTGGLFRKLKRVVERNTKIKPGKSIKIAGFEIAAK